MSLRRFAGRLVHQPLAFAAIIFLFVVIASSVLASTIAAYAPRSQDLLDVLAGPSGAHLLGTDSLGRDVLTRLMFGAQVTLQGVVVAVAVFIVLGVPAGLIAGYRGGWIDSIVTRLTDLAFAVPTIIVVLLVLSVFPNDETAAMITLGVLGAPGLARVVRGATLTVRSELFVTAARTAGLRDVTILRRHVLPNVAGPVIVQGSLFAGTAILVETGLGFLNLGVQQPDPSWGNMVAEASQNIDAQPWLLVPSGLMVALTVLAFGLIGDGLRDAFAERSGSRREPDRHDESPDAVTVVTETPARPSATSGALLSVEALGVTFPLDGRRGFVVQDVSFAVHAGEAVGLIGESGCGKTVTAMSILGLLGDNGRVDTGRVVFDGLDLVDLDDDDLRRVRGRGIGYISQDPIGSLDPVFRVGSQLAEVVRAHTECTRSEANERALELLSLVRLQEPASVARQYPHELSGGMAQRVAIAAALAGTPRLLIADEPTTALDVTIQAEILDLLRTLQADADLAVLLITHDWGVLADLCDRAVVMYAGEVVEEASVAELVSAPLHPYTRALEQSNPFNAVGGAPLPSIEGLVPRPSHWPRGCHFEDRCPIATAECREHPVALVEADADRRSRCIHIDELRVHAST
jgi:peptide/nickel transport system permease protein